MPIDYLDECAHVQVEETFIEGGTVKNDAQADAQSPEAQCRCWTPRAKYRMREAFGRKSFKESMIALAIP